jgi:hypothetical protein
VHHVARVNRMPYSVSPCFQCQLGERGFVSTYMSPCITSTPYPLVFCISLRIPCRCGPLVFPASRPPPPPPPTRHTPPSPCHGRRCPRKATLPPPHRTSPASLHQCAARCATLKFRDGRLRAQDLGLSEALTLLRPCSPADAGFQCSIPAAVLHSRGADASRCFRAVVASGTPSRGVR